MKKILNENEYDKVISQLRPKRFSETSELIEDILLNREEYKEVLEIFNNDAKQVIEFIKKHAEEFSYADVSYRRTEIVRDTIRLYNHPEDKSEVSFETIDVHSASAQTEELYDEFTNDEEVHDIFKQVEFRCFLFYKNSLKRASA